MNKLLSASILVLTLGLASAVLDRDNGIGPMHRLEAMQNNVLYDSSPFSGAWALLVQYCGSPPWLSKQAICDTV